MKLSLYRLSDGPSNVADAGSVSVSSAVGGAIGGGSGSGSSLTPAETASDSESDVNDCDDDDDAFLGCHDDVAVAVSLSPGNKSPTQSVRSLLSRPRSTPMRRATISGSSPSLSRPYINISEVGGKWQRGKIRTLQINQLFSCLKNLGQ